MQNQNLASFKQLPVPNRQSQQLSDQLKQIICAEIDTKGPMTFARYMEIALYAPQLGYYRNGSQKFGGQGDFITAPELSPLFSQCLANQCRQVLQELPGSDILEFGAGSGIMARTILQTLAEMDSLPKQYFILELSAELQQRQHEDLQTHAPQLLSKVTWLKELPKSFRGIVLANEVLDAMPVHRIGYWQGFKEYYVTHQDQQLAWQLDSISDPKLTAQVTALELNVSEGYSSEINCLIQPWLKSLNTALTEGVILLIDYGLTHHEYYHPDRGCGTLLCHFQHRAHDNPFWWPGLQDITAQVNFTAVASAAVAEELTVAGFTHQAAFLLNCGITEWMSQCANEHTRLELNRQIKLLTLPGEMGEAFKVMALTKNYQTSLLGFKSMSQLARL